MIFVRLCIYQVDYGDELQMNFKKFAKIVSLVLVMCIVLLMGVYTARMFVYKTNDGKDAGTTKISGSRVNILVMATDKGGMLTDTIMFASLNKKTNKLNIMSVPRDTRVKLGNSFGKINSAYGMGKEGKRQELSIEKVTELIGMPVNYYVVINPKAFRNIIDILGGVEIDVPQRMYYVDPTQDLVIDLYPGKQVLNGAKAEQFCRFRSGYASADLGRIDAQQMFIKELFKQKLNPKYLGKIDEIYDEIIENIDTNIEIGDVFTFLPVVKAMTGDSMNTFRLPGESATISNISYYICDREETDKLVNEVFLADGKISEPASNP